MLAELVQPAAKAAVGYLGDAPVDGVIAPGGGGEPAQVLLASALCQSSRAVLGISAKAVRARLVRFDAEGVDGCADRPDVGRKRRITENERSRVIAPVKATPPGRLAAYDETGPGGWTLDTLTEVAQGLGAGIVVGDGRRRAG